MINVKSFNAVGDFVADDTLAIQDAINYCFGSLSSPHGIDYYRNIPLFFPSGHYKIDIPGDGLLFSKVQGGIVKGSGRFSTTIQNIANGGGVFRTNGFNYSTISDLNLKCGSDGICLDLDYDGTGGTAALQANSIDHVFCDGTSGGNTIGIRVGQSQFMGSECIFNLVHNQGCRAAGILINNFNALQHQFYGGQDQACGVGIWVTVGSVPIVSGRGFQLQTDCDIKTSGGQHNAMSIVGCRTESPNFIKNDGGQSLDVSACMQTTGNGVPGNFLTSAGGIVSIRSCEFDGKVYPYYWCNLTIDGANVSGPDWLTLLPDKLWYIPHNNIAGNIELKNIIINDNGSVVQISRQRRFTDDGLTIKTRDYVLQ